MEKKRTVRSTNVGTTVKYALNLVRDSNKTADGKMANRKAAGLVGKMFSALRRKDNKEAQSHAEAIINELS